METNCRPIAENASTPSYHQRPQNPIIRKVDTYEEKPFQEELIASAKRERKVKKLQKLWDFIPFGPARF